MANTKNMKKNQTKAVEKAVEKPAATETVQTTVEEPKVVVTPVVEVREPRVFNPDDRITCRSVTQGELLLPGKSGELYRWSAYGDEAYVEYQDLLALKSKKSQYIYNPLFVIEDEELLEDKRWADLNPIYEKLFAIDNFDELLSLPIGKFTEIFKMMPAGMQKSVKIEVATRLEEGTFDSLQKVKAIDEICGSDLACLL